MIARNGIVLFLVWFNCVTEFELGVDDSNLSGFFELNNGCICCTVKDDLVATLEQLTLHRSRFDYILIEATGKLKQSLRTD